jgi:outer membrane lipoprotein-sorting protein
MAMDLESLDFLTKFEIPASHGFCRGNFCYNAFHQQICSASKNPYFCGLIKDGVMFRQLQGRIWVLILAGLFLSAGVAQGAEFSATMIAKSGGQETEGKIFVKGDKIRNEMKAGGETQISIIRPDKKMMWLIMPAQKAYMEMPLNPQATGPMMIKKPEGQVKMKLLGPETVNGYETEKYETSVKRRGQEVKEYIWLSKKLGMPIKMAAADGSHLMEYRDIKEGGVPDDLFQPPQGYHKLQMPMGMPRMK